jgi:copper chaperone NosL
MNNHKIKMLTRSLLFICGLGLIAVLFTPIWRIDLQAPQYPEGLKMFIHADKLAGDVTIINGLNHYIGMKTLHEDDFKEFKVLPVIIIFFSAFFIFTGITGKRRWLNLLSILFIAFGVLAMVDFWRWEFAYGHNLNPNAAIIVPGMSYQPPLIGFKQLLNFGAYSIPATGGWIFIAAGFFLLASTIYEWKLARKTIRLNHSAGLLIVGIAGMSMLTGCSSKPQPIRVGQDNCAFCKMKISDNRFGAEIVTTKSKIYKFDDAHCILSFVKSDNLLLKEIESFYFTNFNEPHQLIKVTQVHFLQSPSLKSPMNGNIAAFDSEEKLVSMLPKFNGNKTSWEEMLK